MKNARNVLSITRYLFLKIKGKLIAYPIVFPNETLNLLIYSIN